MAAERQRDSRSLLGIKTGGPFSAPLPSTLWLSVGLPWPEPCAGDTEESNLDSDLQLDHCSTRRHESTGRRESRSSEGAEKLQRTCCGH